ncbi:MAG: hypothetical protein AAGA47_00175 [Pseudomonadota bacterium]
MTDQIQHPNHLAPYKHRQTHNLSLASGKGWQLKRYAIVAKGRVLSETAVKAATNAAFDRLPEAGTLDKPEGNHGIGFQLFHFSEQIPLVSPVFYWMWGSVLSNALQMRSYSEAPYKLVDGVAEVVGCIWEMEIVQHEINAWRDLVLNDGQEPQQRVRAYLSSVL